MQRIYLDSTKFKSSDTMIECSKQIVIAINSIRFQRLFINLLRFQRTVCHREIETQQIRKRKKFVSEFLMTIGTRFFGFCCPCQCVPYIDSM